MFSSMSTRRSFLALSTSFAATLAGCAAQNSESTSAAESVDSTSAESTSAAEATGSRETITNDTDGGHAIEVSGEEKSYTAVDVTKTGEADGDEADFYGENSAIFATEAATLTLSDVTVTTNGTHANAIFSYGEKTTVNVSDSTIETSGNCSGGVMVTGGGTLNATNVTAHTTGNSSATIRSDRGGGTQIVKGGSFTTDGTGSPVVYSTADVTVEDAEMASTASQGVVVEGKNSAKLKNCTLSADNNKKNGDHSDYYQAVMVYQSMSGDADEGTASFGIEGGSLTNAQGDIFFVTNTIATIDLASAKITNNDADGNFLRAAAAGWGSEGSNGGQVTMNATGQEIAGNMLVDSVSNLNLYLKSGSSFAGAINPEGADGDVYVEVEDGSTWELSADSNIKSLTCGKDAIALNGHTLTVGDAAYEEGTESTGEAIEVTVSESTGGPGEGGGEGGSGGDGGTPPEKPSGEGGPSGDGGTPPEKPSGDSSSSSSSTESTTSAS